MNYFNSPYSQQAYNYQPYQPYQPVQAYQPVQQQVQNVQQPVQKVDFQGIVINSFDEVKSYPVPLGGTVLLLNKGTNKFYLKSLDNNGNPIIETYDFSSSSNELKDNQQVDKSDVFDDKLTKLEQHFIAINKRVSELEDKVKSIK
jgi:hypothetical protein